MSPRWYKNLTADGRRSVWSVSGGFVLDAMDVQLYAFVLPVLIGLWHLSPSRAGMLAAAALISGSIGGWIGGSLSDRLGRVRVLRATILWLAIATALCGLSSSYAQLMSARALQGAGFGAEWAVGAVLIGEISSPATRGRVVSAVQSAWALGWALAAITVGLALWYLPPDLGWRAAFFVGLVPAAAVFWLRARLREAPHLAEAGKGADQWYVIFVAPVRARTWRGILLATGTHGGYWALATWWPSMLRIERSMSALQATLHMGVLVAGSFGGYLLGGWLGDQIGRRITLALLAVGGIVTVLAATLLPLSPLAFLGFSAAVGVFSVGLYGATTPVLTELFPTRMRGSGLGFCYNVGRGLAGAGPLAVGSSVASFGIAPSIGLYVSLAYCLVVVAAVLLPETRGRELASVVIAPA
uniref:MFS transporter n=1 Tax=uncultured Sphingomonas sp. TaxID=158754 RepID=UPI0035CC7B2C